VLHTDRAGKQTWRAQGKKREREKRDWSRETRRERRSIYAADVAAAALGKNVVEESAIAAFMLKSGNCQEHKK